MKAETLKEIGKFHLDLSKIVFASAILSPLLEKGNINGYALIGALIFGISGILFINKGASNE